MFLETWYEHLFRLDESDAIPEAQWAQIIKARSAVSKELEILRKNGDIGSGLNAEVSLICDGELKSALDALDAAAQAACNPINDKRGTVEYRTKVAEFDMCVRAILEGGFVDGRQVFATDNPRIKSAVKELDEDGFAIE